jgi:hypothetical protein
LLLGLLLLLLVVVIVCRLRLRLRLQQHLIVDLEPRVAPRAEIDKGQRVVKRILRAYKKKCVYNIGEGERLSRNIISEKIEKKKKTPLTTTFGDDTAPV